jgi:hypothetical protein
MAASSSLSLFLTAATKLFTASSGDAKDFCTLEPDAARTDIVVAGMANSANIRSKYVGMVRKVMTFMLNPPYMLQSLQ